MTTEQPPSAQRDFFISYTAADQQWAEWIAWQLEEAGYSVILQAWDFAPGAHFVEEMHRATQATKRTIAVLSRAYASSSPAAAEWQEAWRGDPLGAERQLLVLRVEECERPGLLAQIVSVDLFGADTETARARLLATAQSGRRKPPIPPGFPGKEAPANEPPFPGRLIPGSMAAAMAAAGPIAPDNPHAVAQAWWMAVLRVDYDLLSHNITPESSGNWPLEDLRDETANYAIATGVFKPVYDCAYVRLLDGESGIDGPA
ncbi:MAG: toll/interleukin-1 receptor domain-containing protein, partial [Comamonadaceae bacterium]